ncbi:MAG: hypothetical protein K2Q45_06660 [Nitrosomonas sp.]|nr:hypothetical protein [Nitrosomonas sp.]
MNKLIYDYSYGDEDVLSTTIRIFQHENELYTIHFIQETFFMPRTIETSYQVVEKKTIRGSDSQIFEIPFYETVLKIRAPCNPAPEELFLVK